MHAVQSCFDIVQAYSNIQDVVTRPQKMLIKNIKLWDESVQAVEIEII